MSNGWLPPPAVDDEAAAALPALVAEREAALVTAPREAILVELASLFSVMRKGDDGMTKGVVNVYAEDLADIPLAVLHKACVAWRRREVFWPAIAEIRKECEGILAAQRRELRRLRILRAVAEHPAGDEWVTESWLAEITNLVEAEEKPPRTAGPIGQAVRALSA